MSFAIAVVPPVGKVSPPKLSTMAVPPHSWMRLPATTTFPAWSAPTVSRGYGCVGWLLHEGGAAASVQLFFQTWLPEGSSFWT